MRPTKFPFWIMTKQGNDNKLRLYRIVSDFDNKAVREELLESYHGNLMEKGHYREYKDYPEGNYNFSKELIWLGRKPTKKEMNKGQSIFRKWKEKALLEDI